MEILRQKTIVTRRGLKYTFYVSDDHEVTDRNPALLFIHGFPDSAHLWSNVIAALDDLPNKIIVPDCLGYAGTDKPDDTAKYAYHEQAEDMIDILDSENAGVSVIIGHDWGSALAQRVYLHKRKYFCGVVLLNTGYMVPLNQAFDLDAVNEYTTKTLGYPQFSYWEFLTAADAAEIIDNNLDRMWQVLHGEVDDWMRKMFCVPNAMREFLLGNKNVPLKPYARLPQWANAFKQQFKTDGFGPALQMYSATKSNIQQASDALLQGKSLVIDVPMLFFVCKGDAVCVPGMMSEAIEKGLVPDLEQVVLECAHWSPMEKPVDIAKRIRGFVSKRCLAS